MASRPLGCDDDLKARQQKSLSYRVRLSNLNRTGLPNLATVGWLSMPQQVRQLGDVRSDLPRIVARE
jgi:hypothetical protein